MAFLVGLPKRSNHTRATPISLKNIPNSSIISRKWNKHIRAVRPGITYHSRDAPRRFQVRIYCFCDYSFWTNLTLYRLNVEVIYVPDSTPDPFSLLCEAAYRRNTTIPGPDEDPDGWFTLSHANIHGKLCFNGRHAHLRCTVSWLYTYGMLGSVALTPSPYSSLLPNQCIFFSLSTHKINWSNPFSNVTLAGPWFPVTSAFTAKILKHLTHSQTMNTFGFASSVGYIYMKIRSRPIHVHRRSMATRSRLELSSKLRSLRELFGGQSVVRMSQIPVTCRARFIWISSCSPHLSFCCSKFQWAIIFFWSFV